MCKLENDVLKFLTIISYGERIWETLGGFISYKNKYHWNGQIQARWMDGLQGNILKGVFF